MNKIKRILKIYSFVLIVFLSGIAYITWRWVFTLNTLSSPFTTFWSYSLLFAEFLTLIVFTNFSLILLNFEKAKEVKIDNKLQEDYFKDVFRDGELITFQNYCPSVAIFICTLNESVDLLSTTIAACMNIDYPNKKVYVLDDGRREEIKNLTELFEANYITRETNKGFKAGNINNALSLTDSELVVVFDADHIASSTFLRETVYNFIDDSIAMIQTPQHFCNLDAFQQNLKMPDYLANEQDMFYKIIEPSLNEMDAVFCGGTNIIIRRKHLDKVGGFPTTTITEDSLLGLIFHANGYKVSYYNRPIAIGLAATGFDEYIKQRCRWAKGNLQIFMNPQNWNYYGKLKPLPRFLYLSGALYFLTPLARFIFLLAPVLFLFFDISPVFALFYQILLFQVTYFALKFTFILIKNINRGNIVLADVYDLITSIFTVGTIFQTVFIPKSLAKFKFVVTKKEFSGTERNIKYKFILILLFTILLLAEIQGINDLIVGDIYSALAVIANLFWNTINLVVMSFALRVVFDKPEKRRYQRVQADASIDLLDCGKVKHEGHILDTSRSGISFESDDEIENIDACKIKANIGGFTTFIQLLSKSKKGNKYIYKAVFKVPLVLNRMTKRLARRIEAYVRYAYRKPDLWDKEAQNDKMIKHNRD